MGNSKKRAIITGATGMLGVAVANYLLSMDYEVIAVVRPASNRINRIPVSDLVSVIELDLSSIDTLPECLKVIGVECADAFYHFAWDGTFGLERNNLDIQLDNVRNSLNALRVANELGCKSFVGAGSQAEYGRVKDGIKLDSSVATNPENGYGIAKLSACQMLNLEAQKLGIKFNWVRILSMYGPCDGSHTMVMSGIGKMLNGEKASYTKGEQLWDYIYVKDAAKAFYLISKDGKPGKVYTLGSGKVRKLSEYILDIKNSIDSNLEVGLGEIDYYPGQVMYLCANIDELTKDTGFVPETSFSDGIKETIEWYKKEYEV